MTIITLLTDFGLQDGYPGAMKGVIWTIAPQVKIADISHEIRSQDIFHGALTLSRTAWFFPPATIHVSVVDPGVGTRRRPIALQVGDYYFIGPDNGLFTLVLEHAETRKYPIRAVHLNNSAYWLPEVSRVFHGRDIFAPVAAHLANGVLLEDLGAFIHDPVRLAIPHPEPLNDGGWRGQIIEIDHFGNLATNITQEHLQHLHAFEVHVAGEIIPGLVNTFGDRPPGTLVALLDNSASLAVAVVNGNAAQRLGSVIGDPVEVLIIP
jgi:S-adenosyl-L-methionine hydrolase (adenosine-forming)